MEGWLAYWVTTALIQTRIEDTAGIRRDIASVRSVLFIEIRFVICGCYIQYIQKVRDHPISWS
jgi:hypothetical protein